MPEIRNAYAIKCNAIFVEKTMCAVEYLFSGEKACCRSNDSFGKTKKKKRERVGKHIIELHEYSIFFSSSSTVVLWIFDIVTNP